MIAETADDQIRALRQEEPDTVGELVDSLLGMGLPDTDPQIASARRFLLDTQLEDGTWGRDRDDRYAHFHTLWTAIDGLRDHSLRSVPVPPRLQAVLENLTT